MSKYVSKIDGKVFETKEELLAYLENQYVRVEELNNESQYSQILSKLNEAFDGSIIEVTERENGEYYIELSLYAGADMLQTFYFYITNSNHSDAYNKAFNTIEDAIEYYKQYPKQTELIKNTLSEKYELESFKVEQWYEADKYGDSYDCITLNARLNGINMFLESGINQPIENFINSEIEPYFTNEIEGELSYYNHGEWFIGETSLDKLFNRAKKIKVTILE